MNCETRANPTYLPHKNNCISQARATTDLLVLILNFQIICLGKERLRKQTLSRSFPEVFREIYAWKV